MVQTDSEDTPPLSHDDQLLIFDAAENETFTLPLNYEDTYKGRWQPMDLYIVNDKIYFSVRIGILDSNFTVGSKIMLYELFKYSLKNTGIRITNLFHINNNLLYLTQNIDVDDKPYTLWNYNNGSPFELMRSFHPINYKTHNKKVYFVDEAPEYKSHVLESDGTIEGTQYFTKNSETTERDPFLISEEVFYYFKQDASLGEAIFKINPVSNSFELNCVPFPFSEDSEARIGEVIRESIYNPSYAQYTNEDFGDVIYRKENHTFFIDSLGLWFSDAGPANSQLINDTLSAINKIYHIIEFNDKYWFVHHTSDTEQNLYSTDGKKENTWLEYHVIDSVDTSINFGTRGLANSNGIFFKSRSDSVVFYNPDISKLVKLPIKSLLELNAVVNEKVIIINERIEELHFSDGTPENSGVYNYGNDYKPFLMDDKVLMIDTDNKNLYNTTDDFRPKDFLVSRFKEETFYPMFDGNMIFYASEIGYKYKLWVTDGTRQNTKQILDRYLLYRNINLETVYDENEQGLFFSFDVPANSDSLFHFNINEFTLSKISYYSSRSWKIEDIEKVNDKIYRLYSKIGLNQGWFSTFAKPPGLLRHSL